MTHAKDRRETTIGVPLSNLTVKLGGVAGSRVVADAVQVLQARATTETDYDDAGRLTTSTDPLGNATINTYDSSDRIIQTTLPDPDGAGSQIAPVTKSYYGSGEVGRPAPSVRGEEDALGHLTSQDYDEIGRVSQSLFYADSGTTIDDSSGSGFATAGTWTSDSAAGSGYSDSRKRTLTGTGSNTATWTFSGLTAGSEYELLVAWTPYMAYNGSGEVTAVSAVDATYTVYKDSASGGNELETLVVNQNSSPIGDNVFGTGWQSLGRFAPQQGSTALVVQLTDDATAAATGDPDRYVLADAVRLLEPETMTVYSYNALGQLESVADALGSETSYTYDAKGRVVKMTEPGTISGGQFPDTMKEPRSPRKVRLGAAFEPQVYSFEETSECSTLVSTNTSGS